MVVQETDLQIHADIDLTQTARESILRHRGQLESYIAQNPHFLETLTPWQTAGPYPPIVKEMVDAGRLAGVGPMAAVAGAVAQRVGTDLLQHCSEVIVENGGDVFIKSDGVLTVGIYAGASPLSMRLGAKVEPRADPWALCPSSATVGHSLRLGRADAVSVQAASCALADAVATAAGNRVRGKTDVQSAVEFGRKIPGVRGMIVIAHDTIGAWGDWQIVPLA